MRPLPRFVPNILVALAILGIALVFVACGSGNSHSLQSVAITPPAATSQAQFTATGIYNTMPSPVDITATTTWCLGSSNGVCDGDIAQQVLVTAGLAQCL